MPSDAQPPFPVRWFVAMVVAAAATGVGFGVSRGLGIALACLTAIVLGSFMVWAVRDGRRRRAAGQSPDLGVVQRRVRRQAKWGAALVAITTLTSAAALANGDDQPGAWLLMLGPALLTFGVALLWVLGWVVLPRQRAQQANTTD